MSADAAARREEVAVRRDGAVLTVTINRPERLNALTAGTLEDLAELLDETAQDPAVRAVVITGAGRAFSSGADLGVAGATDVPPGPGTLLAGNRVVRTLQSMPQPAVAAVNGPTVGIGCSVALACDLVVAAESAYFYLAFTGIGLMPDGGATALVPASIGRARAMEMALVPERIAASTAREWGLIHRVVPDGELESAVAALAARLVAGPPRALAATKRAVNAACLAGLEDALRRELEGQSELLGSGDFREGVTAFSEKRPPRFAGA